MPTTLLKPRPTRFRERAKPNPAQRVDAANGVLRGVRILGEHSRNGRRYLPEAMRGAARLYENARVFLDHPQREKLSDDRSVRDLVGALRGVHYVDGVGLVGDLHLVRGPHREHILDLAENFSNRVGLSHVADGESRMDGDIEIVESIREVFSVDLVTDAATTAGIFESTRYSGPAQKELDAIVKAGNRFAKAAVGLVRAAHERGDVTLTAGAPAALQDILGRLKTFIVAGDRSDPDAADLLSEFVRGADAFDKLLRDPTRDNAPADAEALAEDLTAILGEIADPESRLDRLRDQGDPMAPAETMADSFARITGVGAPTLAESQRAQDFVAQVMGHQPPRTDQMIQMRHEAKCAGDEERFQAIDAMNGFEQRRAIKRLTPDQARRYRARS